MKNIQIIDGAGNSKFDIYQVSDKLFKVIFPDESDVAFLDDVEKRLKGYGNRQIWPRLYQHRVDKKKVVGIHGTLHLTGSYCQKEYYPTRREENVIQDRIIRRVEKR